MDSPKGIPIRNEKPFQPYPLYPASGYANPLSRVHTIDSQTPPPDDQAGPSESSSETKSDEDFYTGAVKPWRYQEPREQEPDRSAPSYPERRPMPRQPQRRVDSKPSNTSYTGTLQSQQYKYPGVPVNRNQYVAQPYDNLNPYAPQPMAPRRGNRYGKVTIQGNARVIQGNAYDQRVPAPFLREHEYEGVAIDGNASLIQSDVPVGVLPTFWGLNDGSHMSRGYQQEQTYQQYSQQQQQQQQSAPPPLASLPQQQQARLAER